MNYRLKVILLSLGVVAGYGGAIARGMHEHRHGALGWCDGHHGPWSSERSAEPPSKSTRPPNANKLESPHPP